MMSSLKLKVTRPKTTGANVRGPLVLMYTKKTGTDAAGKDVRVKVIQSVNFGDTFEEETKTAYEVLSKYPDILSIAEDRAPDFVPVEDKEKDTFSPSNKMLKKEATK